MPLNDATFTKIYKIFKSFLGILMLTDVFGVLKPIYALSILDTCFQHN